LRDIVKEENLSKQQYEFLVNALQLEFKKRDVSITNEIRDIAYQIIAKQAKNNSRLLQTLLTFNPQDEELRRDLIIHKKGNY